MKLSERWSKDFRPRTEKRQVSPGRTAGVDPAVPLVVPVATTWKEAVVRVVNKEQVRSVKLTQQRMRPIVGGMHPQMLEFLALFYRRMDGRGIPVFCHCGIRTAEQQRIEVLEGHSLLPPERAPHVWGCAVDIVHSIYSWDMSEYEWAIFGEVGKELAIQRSIDIIWGGDWKRPWDPAHWQLRHWRQVMTDYPWKGP